ncbi:MAG: hypothetical protein K5766_05255 [Alphaproteobacteria bacterium]|nr:hypothetical protein [Alphaproteobacteria bacterium]MCR4556184.1 hypothetical protein [Alphaproteobacteria bacterium]
MKQVLTPEDVNLLEKRLEDATKAPWNVIEKEGVDTVWVSPNLDGNPIALFDYHSGEQNRNDAHFIVAAREYMGVMLKEIKELRGRVLELIQSNNLEFQKRMDLQTELNELKKVLNKTYEDK